MTQWSRHELEHKVNHELKTNPGKPINVFETRNFVGQFVSTLDLRTFPFDQQDLRIVRFFHTIFTQQ